MRESGLGVVIGASPLGVGIAAQLANAGWHVRLLDSSLELAAKALAQLRMARPPLLFLPEYLERIEPGNLNDLTACLEADWIVEAVAENLELKRRLLQRLELFIGPTTVVTTTTRYLSLANLLEERNELLQERFFGTNFTSPPRYHKLLEVIPTASTDPGLLAQFCTFAEERLGHRVVVVRDSPGFVATRVFTAHFFDVLHLSLESELDVEQVDALTGRLIGRTSGIFQTADQLGLDSLLQQARALATALPDDPLHNRLTLPAMLATMLANRTWRGFWPREGNLVLDLATGTYRAPRAVHPDPQDSFLIWIQESLFAYLDAIRPQIATSEVAVDQAMEWGFGWDKGPFVLEAERRGRLYAVPSPPPEYLELSHWPVVEQGPLGAFRDLGDGVACFSLHPPQNRLTMATLDVLLVALERAERDFIALVVAGESQDFTAGFSLQRWWNAIERGDFDEIETDIRSAQAAYLRLAQARVPVVGAVQGYTRGGGAELVLHLPSLHLAPETYLGLTQVSAGLLPSFGGIAQLYTRLGDARQVLQLVMGGQVTTSAHEAQRRGFLRPTDTIARNGDRLFYEARQQALELSEASRASAFLAPAPCDPAPLRTAMAELHAAGRITAHELRLSEAVIQVLTGGPNDAMSLRDRERIACLQLCHEPLTQARIRHLLETGQPLRN
ncbi:3-hydroxyacyl-CoA dehydrogenase/enoyl-CoA hydratase family protein [Armatimonas sp.]|uniref:3-hydroxyacyl-CoA dehydrogenase/enoyl-CoA hydratase family protein n=1 Tax=Armatimonas sp. TaxID=1872638 RepID=UPI00375137DC